MKIDEEIQATEDLVLGLRRQHNALISAANAPADILYEIFSFYPAKAKRNAKVSQPPTWRSIPMVCSRWRQTYISNPALWNAPGTIHLPEMINTTRLFLERAYGVPTDLSLHFRDPETLGAKLPKALAAGVPWLRSLEITGICSKLAGLLRVYALAPRLEELRLRLSGDEDGHDISQSTLFAGGVPSLKTLTLTGCVFSWDSPLLRAPTLTDLEIDGHPSLPRPTLEVLLELLQCSSALKSVSLKNCLPEVGVRLSNSIGDKRLELPHLIHLELTSNSPFALHAVATHIRVPTSARFFIRCKDYAFADHFNVDEQHSQALVDAMLSHVLSRGPGSQPREGICLDQHLLALSSYQTYEPSDSSLEFGTMCYGNTDDLDAPFDFVRDMQSWTPSIGLHLSWDEFRLRTLYPMERMTEHAFNSLLSAIPLFELKGAHLSGDAFYHEEKVVSSFRDANNIEALTISRQALRGVLEAISGVFTDDLSFSSNPLFPSLKHLCVCDMPLQTIIARGETAYTHLRAALRRRREAGGDQTSMNGLQQLDRLGIYHTYLPAAQMEELGQLVTYGSVDAM
ncbi:unnamed protein product [Peniophora sp. CBMAI 1063]|nr:unnamed protein product [Peniophora sp. CBMAI 1063]